MSGEAWKPRGTFTHHWFANLSAKLWSKYVLPHFAMREGAIRYLELGVAEGQSLLWAVEHLGRPSGLFVGVDPFLPSRGWKPDEGHAHRDAALKNISAFFHQTPFEGENDGRQFYPFRQSGTNLICEVYPEPSVEFLKREERPFDVVYVDGNHDAPHAVLDMMLGFKLLGEGGLLIVDDYERRYRGGRPQVRVACDAFEATFWGYFDVKYVHPKQICYVKVRRRGRREYPPTLEMGEVIKPSGETGEPIGRE
jgi:hypothetical protein